MGEGSPPAFGKLTGVMDIGRQHVTPSRPRARGYHFSKPTTSSKDLRGLASGFSAG